FGLVDQDTPYVWLLLHLSLLGAVNSLQFTAMNTLTLIDLQDSNAAAQATPRLIDNCTTTDIRLLPLL
ncbi:hypothetical protein ACV344_34740, partial [Pseudomonas aeruginosa]